MKQAPVPKITEMYGKDAFSFRENSIVVTIPFERINKVGKKVGDKKPLNSRRQKIIAEIWEQRMPRKNLANMKKWLKIKAFRE